MLDIKLIRTHPDQIRELCKRRRSPVDFDKLLQEDEEVRALTARIESLRQQRQGGASPEQREAAIAVRNELGKLEVELREARTERDRLWSWVPNLLAPDRTICSASISRWNGLRATGATDRRVTVSRR